MFDYVTLKVIWWVLVGVLLIGFAIMDGHDLGVGALLPFVGKTNEERRAIINTIGPHWEGNQVWFVTAGGAIFAAWPLVYASAFSGFYFAMFLVLLALILRPVAFDYRGKVNSPVWRTAWDWALFVGGAVPALVFGVAFGNILQGVPFHFEDTMMPVYTGSFWALFNPFALLAGVLSVVMIVAHGANYLVLRTEGQIQARAKKLSVITTIIALLCFAIAGFFAVDLPGYVLSPGLDINTAINPLDKVVTQVNGALFINYRDNAILWLVPALAFIGGILSIIAVRQNKGGVAFIASSILLFSVIVTAGVSLFPFVLPSSADLNSSLTVWDSVSSHRTLNVMFWVALIMTPIVIAYTSWAYHVMRGKVTVEFIKANDHSTY